MEFYAAASQIIPVLLLALIFENRMLLRRPNSYDPNRKKEASHWNASQIVVRIWAVVVIGAAEFFAIFGLYQQRTTDLTNGVVWLGLGVALFLLVASVVGHQWNYMRQWWSTEAKHDWWFHGIGAVALLLLTWGFLTAFG